MFEYVLYLYFIIMSLDNWIWKLQYILYKMNCNKMQLVFQPFLEDFPVISIVIFYSLCMRVWWSLVVCRQTLFPCFCLFVCLKQKKWSATETYYLQLWNSMNCILRVIWNYVKNKINLVNNKLSYSCKCCRIIFQTVWVLVWS